MATRCKEVIARLATLWDHLRTSLWPLPLAIVSVCAGGAVFALDWDRSILDWLYQGSVQDAAGFTAALVGAMITVTALSLSITMVVLTLAAQQLGPRLILLFMRSWLTQIIIGLFVGTSVYLLLVLRALGAQDELSANLAVSVGTGLVLLNLIMLVLFVHSLARSIVADHVIAIAGDSFDASLTEAFAGTGAEPGAQPPMTRGWIAIHLSEQGYLQQIKHEALIKAAAKAEVEATLLSRRGDHLLPGQPVLLVSGAPEAMHRAARQAMSIARSRTDNHAPEWTACQLVEIGLRALSAGINDPFTAIAVIDRLSRSIARLHGRPDPASAWADDSGCIRLHSDPLTFGQIVKTAFEQLIESGQGHVAVRARLQTNLLLLQQHFGDQPARAEVIEFWLRHLESTANPDTGLADQRRSENPARISPAMR